MSEIVSADIGEVEIGFSLVDVLKKDQKSFGLEERNSCDGVFAVLFLSF